MLRLPHPDHTPLQSPALPLVVAQVRYSGALAPITTETVIEVQRRVRSGTGVELERVQQLLSTDIVLAPGMSPAAPALVTGVQLSSSDGQWQMTVTPESMALETPSFHSYAEEFRPLLAEIVAIATDLLAPLSLVRAGLRFVNLLVPPAPGTSREGPEGTDWARWIRPVLSAPVMDDWMRVGVISFAQQALLDVGDGIRCSVRSGPVDNDGTPAFLVDIDTFVEPQSVWAGDSAAATFDTLNARGVALFQALITTEMLDHLRGKAANGVDSPGEELS